MLPPQEHLRLLQARAAGIPSRQQQLDRARRLRFTEPGFDRAVWQQMCAKGWLGLALPQPAGGGRPARAFCRIAEQCGEALAPEPLLSAAMAARLLPAAHLPALLSGARLVLPAWQEVPHSLALTGATVLQAGRLTGRKLAVPMAAGADAFLVTVPDGLALVERTAPGLAMATQPTPDGGHLAMLSFRDTPAEPLDGDATDALDHLLAATAGYLLGLMTGAVVTISNRSTPDPGDADRQRADMQAQLALTRAAIDTAATALDREARRPARQAAVSRAMLRAADAAMTVTAGCVRLHHASAEAAAFRQKALVLAGLYGAPSEHRARCRTR